MYVTQLSLNHSTLIQLRRSFFTIFIAENVLSTVRVETGGIRDKVMSLYTKLIAMMRLPFHQNIQINQSQKVYYLNQKAFQPQLN